MKIMDNYSKEELQSIVNNNTSYTRCLQQMGYTCITGETCTKLQNLLKELNIDTSNLDNQKHASRRKQLSNDEIFSENSTVHQSTLRRHYLELYPNDKCSICGNSKIWRGQELSMILDHINGSNHDNRIENLRWVCPNCNSLLPTTGSRNKH